jgi:hypothetical protein
MSQADEQSITPEVLLTCIRMILDKEADVKRKSGESIESILDASIAPEAKQIICAVAFNVASKKEKREVKLPSIRKKKQKFRIL